MPKDANQEVLADRKTSYISISKEVLKYILEYTYLYRQARSIDYIQEPSKFAVGIQKIGIGSQSLTLQIVEVISIVVLRIDSSLSYSISIRIDIVRIRGSQVLGQYSIRSSGLGYRYYGLGYKYYRLGRKYYQLGDGDYQLGDGYSQPSPRSYRLSNGLGGQKVEIGQANVLIEVNDILPSRAKYIRRLRIVVWYVGLETQAGISRNASQYKVKYISRITLKVVSNVIGNNKDSNKPQYKSLQ